MKRKYILILSFLMLSPLMLFSQQQESIADEEYNVYSNLLPKLTNWPGHSNESDVPPSYIVVEKTSSEKKSYLLGAFPLDIENIKRFKQETKMELTQDIIDDFNQKLQNSYKLEQRFRTLIPVVLISGKELDALFGNSVIDGWCNFYDVYPNSSGLIELSRVGFNKDKTLALVNYGHQWRCRAGKGFLVLMQKKGDEWVILYADWIWVS